MATLAEYRSSGRGVVSQAVAADECAPGGHITTSTARSSKVTTSGVLPERAALTALLGTVGLFVIVPYVRGLDGGSGPVTLSSVRVGGTLAVELGLSVLLGWWLWRLGWRPHLTTTRPFVAKDLLRGLGLWLAVILAVVAWSVVCRWLLPDVLAIAMQTQWAGRPHLALVVPFVLFNAVFEELLWLGLALIAFGRFGRSIAGAVSVGLRLLVHAYQGPLALISIVPMGTVFTIYYMRSHRLWPVVVAHAFQDLIAFGALALGAAASGAV